MEDRDTTEELPATVEEIDAWMADASPAAVEAQASWWLRSMAILDVEVARIDAREEAELERVRSHYAAQRAPLTERHDALERCVLAMAERVQYPKGKKSLALAWGTIGSRTQPQRVAVVDAERAVRLMRDLLPSAIRVKESVDVRAATPAVLNAVAAGIVPDGFEVVPEHEKAYATPNSAAASGVA
jgi:phage host-nuclease inhibitor protein Gam